MELFLGYHKNYRFTEHNPVELNPAGPGSVVAETKLTARQKISVNFGRGGKGEAD